MAALKELVSEGKETPSLSHTHTHSAAERGVSKPSGTQTVAVFLGEVQIGPSQSPLFSCHSSNTHCSAACLSRSHTHRRTHTHWSHGALSLTDKRFCHRPLIGGQVSLTE